MGSSEFAVEESESEEDDGAEEPEFALRVSAEKVDASPAAMYAIEIRCRELRKFKGEGPAPPLRSDGVVLIASDLETAMKVPLYSCHFQNNL